VKIMDNETKIFVENVSEISEERKKNREFPKV
jgi:hypothetical protein